MNNESMILTWLKQCNTFWWFLSKNLKELLFSSFGLNKIKLSFYLSLSWITKNKRETHQFRISSTNKIEWNILTTMLWTTTTLCGKFRSSQYTTPRSTSLLQSVNKEKIHYYLRNQFNNKSTQQMHLLAYQTIVSLYNIVAQNLSRQKE